MSTDNSLRLRQDIVAYLKTFAPLTALVAAPHIHGERVPANPIWPFTRYSATTLPFEASCWSGSTHLVTLHAFANGPYTDSILKIGAQLVEAMKGFAPEGGIEVEWAGNVGPLNDSPEGETSKYHLAVQFNVTLT